MSASIALVDDDRNILSSLSIALIAEGFTTRLYPDGNAALKALIENPPDLVVCDIKMPNMDGVELLRRLREKSSLPFIRIAMRSAMVSARSRSCETTTLVTRISFFSVAMISVIVAAMTGSSSEVGSS